MKKLLFIVLLILLLPFTQAEIVYAQIISTVAGNGISGGTGDGGPATAAEFKGPNCIVFDANNNFYIADSGSATIRMVNAAGIINRVAGSSFGGGYSGDGGQATIAGLNRPTDVAFDAPGNMYITDQGNQVIRKVNTAGIISTFAGSGIQGFGGDGAQATAAKLNNPQNICFDTMGNMYLADKGNNRVRKINPAGIISTVAGTGTAGYNGDGASAIASQLNGPYSVCFDAAGNMFIADCYNYRIRKVNTAGIISTVVGNGTGSYGGDGGAATAAGLFWPAGIIFDGAGNLYISDFGTDRVRMVNTNGIINTIAGNGTWAYSGDGGTAIAAELNGPYGIAFDASGSLYIADILNNRIRMVTNVAIAGIEELKNQNEELLIYPNPASTIMNVEFKMQNDVQNTIAIYNMMGDCVYHQITAVSNCQIDISTLANGIYTLSLSNSTGRIVKRLIKE